MQHRLLLLGAIIFFPQALLILGSTPYPVFNGYLCLLTQINLLGYQVFDLTGTTTLRFDLEASPWNGVSLVTGNKTSKCGTYPILGGFDILQSQGYFERTYSSLPSHNAVYFQFRFFIIDTGNWSPSDNLKINLEGNVIAGKHLSNADLVANSSICGQPNKDELLWYTIVGRLPHNGRNFSTKILSSINKAPINASFGVRDISLIFTNTTGLSNTEFCFRGFDNILFGGSNECKCQRGKYMNPSNYQCVPCNSSCADCFGNSASECYVCSTGYSFIGSECVKCHSTCKTCFGPNSNQCITCNNNSWLQADGSCNSNCSYPVQFQEQIDDFKLCKAPCQTNEYLFWDNTCNISCVAPFQGQSLNSVNNCINPCQSDANQFLFWDGSCLDDCSSPYQQSTLKNVKICNPPCADTSLFYFQNGSCQPDCSYPLIQRIHLGVKFCDLPCQTGEYLFLNNSCITTCDSPYVKALEDNINMCKSPCSQEYEYFYQKENTCKDSCDSPNILSQTDYIKICDEYFSGLLTKTEIQRIEQAATVTNVASQSTSVGIMATNIASSGNPQGISLASLVKMLQYIRYMEINYPPDVELMLMNQDPNSISLNFGVELPRVLEDQIPKYPLPAKFDQYGLYSSFILNFWEEMCTILIVILVICFCSSLIPLIKRFKYPYLVFARILSIARWDFLILVVSTNFDGIVMFSSLELRNVHLNSFLEILSFLICVLMNLVALFLIIVILYIVRDLQKSKNKVFLDSRSNPLDQEHNQPYSKRWKYCQIVFRNFVNTSFMKQGYMFFFLLRIYLFNLTIGYLFEYPLLQASIITALSLLIICYVIILRPLKKKFDMIQFLVNETAILIVNINVLILAIFDAYDVTAQDSRRIIGRILVVLNLAFSIIVLVFLVIEILIKLFRIYKIIRALKGRGIVSQIQELLLIFFEEDGLAVEEKDVHRASIVPVTDQNKSLSSVRMNTESAIFPSSQRRRDPSPLIRIKGDLGGYEKKNTVDTSRLWPLKSSPDNSPLKLSKITTSPSPLLNHMRTSSIQVEDQRVTTEEDVDNKGFQNGMIISLGTLRDLDGTKQKSPLFSLPKSRINYESPLQNIEEVDNIGEPIKSPHENEPLENSKESSKKRPYSLNQMFFKQNKEAKPKLNRGESLTSTFRTPTLREELETLEV